MKSMCGTISPNIKLIKLDVENLTQGEYSNLLTTQVFWSLFNGEKILLYQEDSCFFGHNIKPFLKWDYIGAPWPLQGVYPSNGVGNGGFSLRTKQCMIDVINTQSVKDTVPPESVRVYMMSSKLEDVPEDVYFSLVMEKYKIGKVAPRSVALLFSSESHFSPLSFGGHNFWLSNPRWVNHFISKSMKLVNVNSTLKSTHRGGWSHIIGQIHEKNVSSNNSDIQLVDVVEKFFLWDKKPAINGPWVGIIHCTPDTPPHLISCDSSQLFLNNGFIKSMPSCRLLITLSNPLKEYIISSLLTVGISHIPVISIKHPTITNVPLFDMSLYKTNANKYIVQVGQQMRRMASLYKLPPIKNHSLLWLTGNPDMGFCRKQLLYDMSYNKWNIVPNMNTLYYTKTYEEFDSILEKNIVFMDVYDAAANNTVVECIVRNTPLIINRNAGIIDYLGEGYPLYFDTLEEVASLLTTEKISAAHEYLKAMDKKELHIDTFIWALYNAIYRYC